MPTDAKSHQHEGSAQATLRRRRGTILRALVGIGMFALLFAFLRPREILAALSQARLSLVLAGFGLCVAGVVIRAYRWKYILGHLGIGVPFWRAVEVYTISLWFTTFLPGTMGGDLYKVYDVSRASAKKLRPALTVVAERLTGVLALLAVAMVALLFFHKSLPIPPWALGLVLGTVTTLTFVVIAAFLWLEPIWKLAARYVPFLTRVVSEEKAEGLWVLCEELRGNRALFAGAFALGLVVQLLALSAYYVLGLAVTDNIPAVYFFAIMPLIEVACLIPLTVNGIGIKEGLLVFSLQYAQIDSSFSMSLGILFRIVMTVLAVIGGLLLLARGKGRWQAAVRGGQATAVEEGLVS